MTKVESLLARPSVVGALNRDDLEALVNAFNNLGAHGPGVTAAAQRVGRLVPEIRDGETKA